MSATPSAKSELDWPRPTDVFNIGLMNRAQKRANDKEALHGSREKTGRRDRCDTNGSRFFPSQVTD